ncbi:MAG: transporter substrate-binding domain-containing protein [Lachnospiraceae bacterium]|nr:transporter substrate-binding domain-containing protein [Lachnospiraceae bacterium]
MTKRKTITTILCVLLILLTAFPMTVPAAESKEVPEKVRVGYVNVKTYEEGGEGEYKRGFGYEYLQRISYMTGWEYEYVHASFKSCLDMLINGEIDMMGNVSYTPERAEKVLFSAYPQGKEFYWLFTSKDHTELLAGDLEGLMGSVIGVTEGTVQETLLKDWLVENEVSATVVGCGGYDDLMARIDAGELDVIATSDLSMGYHYKAITSFGSSEYYFAVSKNRPELLDELNEALRDIQNSDADFNSNLNSKYQYMMASDLMLNADEQQWLAEHDNTIRLGSVAEYLPFIGEENGETVGVITTVIKSLEEDYGVNVELKTYPDMESVRVALDGGEIDLGGPLATDYYLAEQNKLVLTDAIIATTPVVLYRGDDFDSSVQTLAASELSVFTPRVAGILFPGSTVQAYDTPQDCMQAVADGEVGAMLIPSVRINILRSNSLIRFMSIAELSQRMEISMAATRDNRQAALIMNKAISYSAAILGGVTFTQNTHVDQEITVMDFLKQHMLFVIVFLGIIIAILAYLTMRLINNKKKLVQALEEANVANKAKTDFLFSMSHDIRTPMNASVGFTELLEKNLDNPERSRNYLRKIKDANRLLLSIINNVLEMSRIESGSISVEEVVYATEQFNDAISSIFEEMMAQKDITFTRSINVEHDYVYCDPLKLREIFVNIIGNAYKYTNPGGRVHMALEEVPSDREGWVLFRTTISDTGIGMDEDFLPHIFDPFTREGTTTQTKIEGTGLGLSIVKRLIDLLDGTVEVKSQKGEGTSFIVTIPHRIASGEDLMKFETTGYDVAAFKGKRVLLAEDNDLNAEIAYELLTEAGFVVEHAENGLRCYEMLQLAEEGYYDLVLMDVQMPEMNGYDATRAIRSLPNPAKASVPIVAMTANAFEEDKRDAFEAGMNGHIAKPIDIQKLMAVLADVLNTSK